MAFNRRRCLIKVAVTIIDPLNKRLRALSTIQCPDHIQPNESKTGYRVSSGAFIVGSDGTNSVDLEESLLAAGLPATGRYPALARAVALVGHTIETYEKNSFSVTHDPVPDNDHHGSARTQLKNKPARRAARAMAEQARFVVPIDTAVAVALGAPALE